MSTSNHYSRRRFISTLSAGSVSAAVAGAIPASAEAIQRIENTMDEAPAITDTNVHLFQWPFRNLKYGNTKTLVEKLRRHRITQAWAGNYEALFSKSIDVSNSRLVKECRENGKGMLVPIGTVNPTWPDWEEDLRRCDEVHRITGIRVYPGYQMFDLNDPEFSKLISEAAKRKIIVQIVGDIEDTRVHHPIVATREFKFDPIVDIMKKNPDAKVQLLGWNLHLNNALLKKIVEETTIVLDISWLESVGALGHAIEGKSWNGSRTPVPAERFLFGSNAPLFPVEAGMIKLFESPLTLQQMKTVMHENARNFIQQAKHKI